MRRNSGCILRLAPASAPILSTSCKRICLEIAETFPHVVFFAGKLVWDTAVEGFLSRFLHNHTALELQSWLQLYGYSLVILPIRVGPPLRPRPREENDRTNVDSA